MDKKKAITKDVWNMVFDLMGIAGNLEEEFDEDGAWPVMIDEFVSWVKKKEG